MDALRAGWTSGEDYDWHYTDDSRAVKAALAPAYANKNISWWWNNTHTNPNGATTAWVPQSKPIWFSEYGFASVDGCANQPNVFVDSMTYDSAYPRFSRGRVDFMAQRTAIAATEMQWAGSSMVTQRFLWTWDARPYPYWPDLREVWSDGGNWVTGHWVQGKLGASHVAAAIRQIVMRAGLDASQIDTSQVQLMLDGFVLHERVTARAALQQLMDAYFFTIKESAGALVAIPRDSSVDATLDVAQCVPQKAEGQEVPYVLERQEDLILPARVEVQYLNRLQSYETEVESAIRSTQSATDTSVLAVSLVLAQAHAQAMATTLLADRWAQRCTMNLQVPMAFAALEPGDVVMLNDGALSHRIRLDKVQIGKPGLVKLAGVIDASDTWDGYIVPTEGGDGVVVKPSPATRLEVLDIPALPNDTQDALTLRFAACGVSDGWTGATLTHIKSSGDDEVLMDITTPATIGSSLTTLPSGSTQVFDRVNTVDVALLGSGVLASASEASVLNGANVAVLGDEVIQFAQATLVSAGVYRLSTLLRGRLGTEIFIGTHTVGERFVLIDAALVPLTIPVSNNGQQWTIRASTFGTSLSAGSETVVTIKANSLKPYSPVGLKAVRNGGTGDITISWCRRARIDGSLRDYVEIPLMEHDEQYDVTIYNGSTVMRNWRVGTPSVVYSAAAQVTDFGAAPSSLTVGVTQLSSLVGLGNVQQLNLSVQ